MKPSSQPPGSSSGSTTTTTTTASQATPARQWPRMSFQDAMALTPLPSTTPGVKTFVSRQPAWTPGAELPWHDVLGASGIGAAANAYGGHVFAQAPLAAARALELDAEAADGEVVDGEAAPLGIHTIQGVFTAPGRHDRPFVYDVSPLSSGRSFVASLVNARQPERPSAAPRGPFAASEAGLALDAVCFSCITTFKRRRPSPTDVQAPLSAQQRYAAVLAARAAPDRWEPSPQVDLDGVRRLFPGEGAGAFPILALHKVDMGAWNADKPVAERRELIYYRLLQPLPADDVNAHVVCHAFEADRNGLLMIANHVGYGHGPARVASLSYSFYVHVNADEAVMDARGWWLQEVYWPRVSAGRCMMESKLWSPDGKHVASGYQDGIVLPGQPGRPRL